MKETRKLNISKLTFQDPLVEEGVLNSRGRIEEIKMAMMGRGKMFTYEQVIQPLEITPFTDVENRHLVFDGNHRLQAYKELGIEDIPVVFYRRV